MKRSIALLVFLLLSLPAFSGEPIDLTYSFDKSTIYWPTAKGFELNRVFAGMTEKGYYYAGYTFCAPEHGGTHLDAPLHFAKGKWTVDEIPLSHLIGDAVVIDVRDKVKDIADSLISSEDIQAWEKINGPVSEKSIVLFHTGWGRYWGNKKKYLGTDKFKDVENLHFPGLSPEAATYLASKKVKGVGLDTPSLDPGISQDFMAHRILLEKNIYGLENVANLDRLPPRGARLIVAPMKIGDGTGAPTRILAEVP